MSSRSFSESFADSNETAAQRALAALQRSNLLRMLVSFQNCATQFDKMWVQLEPLAQRLRWEPLTKQLRWEPLAPRICCSRRRCGCHFTGAALMNVRGLRQRTLSCVCVLTHLAWRRWGWTSGGSGPRNRWIWNTSATTIAELSSGVMLI